MQEEMSLSVNGQSQVPPGFRFHPTEEELLHYYLRKKVAYEEIDLDVIRDVDLNKLEPWDIQEKCRIGSTPQNDWYFFSHKDKKYPTGTRTNRATAAGFWKATGRDKVIYSSFKRIGMRKTLVFYKGRAPHGQKSDWIMHEYRLEDTNTTETSTNVLIPSGETTQEDGWVVCRVFKKKNHHKSVDSPNNSSMISASMKTQMLISSSSDGALDQILQYMGRTCKQENETNNNMRFIRSIDTSGIVSHERFLPLPPLEMDEMAGGNHMNNQVNLNYQMTESGLSDWATLDRLVASHLNGQTNDQNMSFCSDHDLQLPQLRSSLNRSFHNSGEYNNSEIDLWSFTRSSSSSSDPLAHVSNASI